MKTEKTDINLTPEQAEAMLREVAMQLATRYQQDPIEGSMVFQLTEAWQEKVLAETGYAEIARTPAELEGFLQDELPATVMSPEWAEIDRGVLTEEEVVALLTKNAPDYPEQIRRIVHDSHELVTVYPYAADWVRDLKKKGYKVYILSNFSEFGFNRVKDTFDFLPYADGALISYEVKLVKPDRKIYETLCERFDITPENAVFLDDNAKNTEAARKFGLHTITVENKEQTDRDLHALGVTW